MAQDFTRYAVQTANGADAIFATNSNDAVIGIRIANIVTLNSDRCFCGVWDLQQIHL